jgi:hypothetical protein
MEIMASNLRVILDNKGPTELVYLHCRLNTVKKVCDIPAINFLFPKRESVVSEIPAGDGNVANLFYGVGGVHIGARALLDI